METRLRNQEAALGEMKQEGLRLEAGVTSQARHNSSEGRNSQSLLKRHKIGIVYDGRKLEGRVTAISMDKWVLSRINVGRSKRIRSVRIQSPSVEGEYILSQKHSRDPEVQTVKVLQDHEEAGSGSPNKWDKVPDG